ncbi:predicted protein [Plenodomus lingam JN3]|uniref:Predicted protein n=1 Tax=Leptosphaeria maculans (strain JN3 / isolate v23.1.3 / race Av1-4-5-6-7-8) TaxID=985895 RepID=E5AA15_LEPMJ|nr:predicted protein [Plenodomus lingam JN3]CBY00506.1 predicted protein [Plenodomus lingam JN3]
MRQPVNQVVRSLAQIILELLKKPLGRGKDLENHEKGFAYLQLTGTLAEPVQGRKIWPTKLGGEEKGYVHGYQLIVLLLLR